MLSFYIFGEVGNLKLFKKIILSSFVLYSALYAGNTGKIVGIATDKNSKEPLPGVNVILIDSRMGAATDINGEYYILNVPPGSYSIECTYIGYQTIIMEKVQVQSDQTTILNMELIESTMELDEAIVVTAERPLVQKDLTSSKKVTTAEEIKALPVETFSGILATQAGVTQGAEGELHIRGGRSNEIGYLVDGVSLANPYSTNGLATSVATNAIQEMTVVSGAFNAEYGNAMSGIVNLVTKDGGNKFSGGITAYSGDYISGDTDLYLNINDVNLFANKNIEGNFSGPIPGKNGLNHSFFISGRYYDREGYLFGQREHSPQDTADFTTKVSYDTIEVDDKKYMIIPNFYERWDIQLSGDNAYVPLNSRTDLNLLAKLKMQLSSSTILRFQSIYDEAEWKEYYHSYKYNPDGNYNYFSESMQNSLRLMHTISPSTFFELRAAHNYRNYKQYVYEDPKDPRYAQTDNVRGNVGAETFAFGGTRMGHIYEDSQTYIGKADLTSQVTKRHLLKLGVEARLYKLNRENFTILYDHIDYLTPTVLGYNSPYHDKFERWPKQASAYLQDKIEFEDMIMNIGLRYDYFDADADYAVDILQPDGLTQKSKPKNLLSPRVGISFPITSRGIIHFSYGHFAQMPSFKALYVNPDFELPKSGTPEFGYANLRPQRTIMYEMGLQQQLTDDLALDATAYYRDVRDLLAWQNIRFITLEGEQDVYRVRQNQDYANIKGFTVTINKRLSKSSPVGLRLDYTFQITEGNDNDENAFYYNNLSGQETIKELVPLDWDQTHNLYGTIMIQPVDNLLVSFVGKLNSGLPYSPQLYKQNYDTSPNSSSKPSRNSIDLLTSYRFELGGLNYTIFTKIYNLLDTRNEIYVFNDTGRAYYTFANADQDETETLINNYGKPGVHTYKEYITRPNYFRPPREVRIGISIDF